MMIMKKVLFIVALLSIGTTGIVSGFGCIKKGTGTLVLQITDKPSELNITHAWITISSVEVHSVVLSGNGTFGKWYTIVNTSQTFDLIAIEDAKTLLGSKNLSAGWYTQIRLNIVNASAIINGEEYVLKVPSKKVKIVRPFRVRDNQTTTLTLDFDAQNSIHSRGHNKYSLRPTIKVIREK
jgi:hypothetical protein